MSREGLTRMTKIEVVVRGSDTPSVSNLLAGAGVNGYTSLSGVSGFGHNGRGWAAGADDHHAAISLGVELRVLAESAEDPAVCAGARHRFGSAAALADLRALATDADVLTFDHERISPEHLRTLEDDGAPLAPGASAKLMAQTSTTPASDWPSSAIRCLRSPTPGPSPRWMGSPPKPHSWPGKPRRLGRARWSPARDRLRPPRRARR